MSRVLNTRMIDGIEEFIQGSPDLVLLDLSKLDANSSVELRRKLRAKKVNLLSARSALVNIGLSRRFSSAQLSRLSGAITMAAGADDIVSLAKAVKAALTGHEKAEVVGGVVEGKSVDAKSVEVLSKSPGRAELLSELAGMIGGVGSQLAGVLQAVGEEVAGVCDAIAEKQSAPQ